MDFVTWSTLDELSDAPTKKVIIAGQILEELTQLAISRGHTHPIEPSTAPAWIAVTGPAERGTHLLVPDEPLVSFHLQLTPAGDHHVDWHVGSTSFSAGVGHQYVPEFLNFLAMLSRINAGSHLELGALLEEYVAVWHVVARDLPLDADERRVSDALVAMFGELAKVADPPKSTIREALSWFKPRLESFADGFASTAGKVAGAAAGGGLVYTATKVPEILELLHRIIDSTSRP